METDEKRIRALWNNGKTSVILRRDGKGEKLRVRVANNPTHDYLVQGRLMGGRRIRPIWDYQGNYWETPKSWFNGLVHEFLQREGSLYVIQPYREQEKCCPACQNAKGHECQCSCMGEFHGAANINSGWFIVSDTFATRWGRRKLACRLIKAK